MRPMISPSNSGNIVDQESPFASGSDSPDSTPIGLVAVVTGAVLAASLRDLENLRDRKDRRSDMVVGAGTED